MSPQPTAAPPRLGNLLVERGYLTVEELESGLAAQHQGGKTRLLGEILVDMELCTEDQVTECLAVEYGVPYAKLEARLVDPKVLDALPREYIERNFVLPLFKIKGVLTIADSELANLFLIDEIRSLGGCEVQIVASTQRDIRRIITSLPDSKVFVIDDIIEDSDGAEVTLIEEALEDRWGAQEDRLLVQGLSGWRLSSEIGRLRASFDHILVDSPPHAESDARTAIREADLVLLPCQPHALDVWATQATLDLARSDRTDALLVLNRVPPRGRVADRIRA
jgi:hypothetical protein